MNTKQAILQAMLIDAICETVIEIKEAPEGPMYAAFMSKGCTLEQFNCRTRNSLNRFTSKHLHGAAVQP